MAIITRFGGSGGGTPIVDPYPHVWECTVVQSGTTGVVSGVVTLEAYDILHYTMPLGFSTYDLMIGGVTYHTSFRNEGEMYTQWTGTEFVVVSANAACALSHVWTSPTYTITGTLLEITGGVDDLHTNDVIVLTLASGESASNIEYNSQVYTIDLAISNGTNYVQFNGTSFDNALFNFKGDATVSDVRSGKTFYSSDGTLRTGNASMRIPHFAKSASQVYARDINDNEPYKTLRFTNFDLDKTLIAVRSTQNNAANHSEVGGLSVAQVGSDIEVSLYLPQVNSGVVYAGQISDEYIDTDNPLHEFSYNATTQQFSTDGSTIVQVENYYSVLQVKYPYSISLSASTARLHPQCPFDEDNLDFVVRTFNGTAYCSGMITNRIRVKNW